MDQTVKGAETVTLQGSGSDADGTITSYLWEQTGGDTVVITNTQSAQASFTAPSTLEDMNLTFKLTVTDNDGETAQAEVNVLVTPENTPEVTLHFPPATGIYRANSIAAFGVASAVEADVVSVTLDAGAGPVQATLMSNGKWRANNIPVPAGVNSFELIAEVTDSLARKSRSKSQLKTSGSSIGSGPTWTSTVALAVIPSTNTGYVLTSGSFLSDVNLLPINLATGERGPALSTWSNAAQGVQIAPLAHMIYHSQNKKFYALTDSTNGKVLISINPTSGMRELASGVERGDGDLFEYPIALAQGPGNSVFISDNKAAKIFQVNTTTGKRTTLVDQQTVDHFIKGAMTLAWSKDFPDDLYLIINNDVGSILRINLNESPITSKVISQDDTGTGPSIRDLASDIILDPTNKRALVLQGKVGDGIIAVQLGTGNRTLIADDVTTSRDRKRGMAFDAEKQLIYTAGGYLIDNRLNVIDAQSGGLVTISQ